MKTKVKSLNINIDIQRIILVFFYHKNNITKINIYLHSNLKQSKKKIIVLNFFKTI